MIKQACYFSRWPVPCQDGLCPVKMACALSRQLAPCKNGLRPVKIACALSVQPAPCQNGLRPVKIACALSRWPAPCQDSLRPVKMAFTLSILLLLYQCGTYIFNEMALSCQSGLILQVATWPNLGKIYDSLIFVCLLRMAQGLTFSKSLCRLESLSI